MGFKLHDPFRYREFSQETFKRDFVGENVWIKFTSTDSGKSYEYPHDQYLNWVFKKTGAIKNTSSWKVHGAYTFTSVSNFRYHGFLKYYEVET